MRGTMKRAAGLLAMAVLVAGIGGRVQGAEEPTTKILFDFENGKAQPFTGGKTTSEHSLQGKFALLADKEILKADVKEDWSGYDLFKIDVFNPSDAPVKLLVELRDAETKEYWTRVNYQTIVAPGKSTVTIPTDMYVGEKSRPGRPLVKSKVRFIALAPNSYPLMFDDFRLEKVETAAFEGLKAFDFGTAKSPVMTGYTGVNPETGYTKELGHGFLRGPKHYATGFDGMQPDALFQDFIATPSSEFQVDVPNGKYHVVMNIDSPGGYWGEVQFYSQRRVSVNGKTVVDEKMTREDFQKQYFHNAHREDLPGLDVFKEYVEPMFHVKQFDIEVTDGKAVFLMQGEGRFPISLSALVMYPAGKMKEGLKFWDWTTAQRRGQFDAYFKQVVPKVTGAKAPATGYVLFSRNFMTTPNAFDGPRENEAIGKEGLALTAARGEEGALTFSVQPSADLGAVEVAISNLEFGGPTDKSPAPLDPTGIVEAGWLDYRISRVSMDGTAYQVAPRYWHPMPAPSAGKMTRTLWLRIKPPVGALPGPWHGTVTVKPAKGEARTIPLTINVLPFELDRIKDVAAGPWGSSIGLPWDGSDPATAKWDEQMLEKSLSSINDSGSTTVTGLPHIGMKAAGGKVTLDFSRADMEMKLLRRHGFDQMINNYGTPLAYPMYGKENGPDEAWAKDAGFANMEAFLKALYGQIEEHGKANNWLPVAWNLCDEPLGDAAKASAKNAALHEKVSKELGLKLNVFTGATSMEGNDPANVHYALVRALGMPSLNLHDEAAIKLIQADGHKFSFYNGGNRWTYGRYMKALVVKYGMAYRTSWHFNVVAGDPYYALDCREDDYCWYNTDAEQRMVPSLAILGGIQPGLNDYRYLTTLQRLISEKKDSANVGAAKKVYEEQVELVAGKDRSRKADFVGDREAVVGAILSLLEK